MNLNEFISKYDGKGIDFDGAWGDQCVDLFRQYVKEVLRVPQSPPVIGAKHIWDSYLPEHFSRIDNTLRGVPKKGDVVIWGVDFGEFGHVAIFIEGTTRSFKSFDQNYPLGSKCHIQSHKYTGVLGWLSFKTKELTINDQTKINLGDPWGELEVQAIRSKLNDQKRDFDALKRERQTA